MAGGAQDVEDGTDRLLSLVRAHRPAGIRKRCGLTQRDVAAAMGVTVGRVCQIEAGDISGIDILDRHITAIGGPLEIVANFGDEQSGSADSPLQRVRRIGRPGPIAIIKMSGVEGCLTHLYGPASTTAWPGVDLHGGPEGLAHHGDRPTPHAQPPPPRDQARMPGPRHLTLIWQPGSGVTVQP